jgi:hypothetical protein
MRSSPVLADVRGAKVPDDRHRHAGRTVQRAEAAVVDCPGPANQLSTSANQPNAWCHCHGRPARAGNRHFWLLSALRTHTKALHKIDWLVENAKAASPPRVGPDWPRGQRPHRAGPAPRGISACHLSEGAPKCINKVPIIHIFYMFSARPHWVDNRIFPYPHHVNVRASDRAVERRVAKRVAPGMHACGSGRAGGDEQPRCMRRARVRGHMQRGVAGLVVGVDVKVILTPPCIFCTEDH